MNAQALLDSVRSLLLRWPYPCDACNRNGVCGITDCPQLVDYKQSLRLSEDLTPPEAARQGASFGKQVDRATALGIAAGILERAELERAEVADAEARKGFTWLKPPEPLLLVCKEMLAAQHESKTEDEFSPRMERAWEDMERIVTRTELRKTREALAFYAVRVDWFAESKIMSVKAERDLVDDGGKKARAAQKEMETLEAE